MPTLSMYVLHMLHVGCCPSYLYVLQVCVFIVKGRAAAILVVKKHPAPKT